MGMIVTDITPYRIVACLPRLGTRGSVSVIDADGRPISTWIENELGGLGMRMDDALHAAEEMAAKLNTLFLRGKEHEIQPKQMTNLESLAFYTGRMAARTEDKMQKMENSDA